MLYNYLIDEYEKYDLLSEKEKNLLEHVNCCEKILFGLNEIYDLGLDKNALKLARGFGGGMNVEGTCGVITGGVMGLSSICYGNDNYKEVVRDFVEKYKRDYKSIECDELKEEYRNDEFGCRAVILNAASVLDDIIRLQGDGYE